MNIGPDLTESDSMLSSLLDERLSGLAALANLLGSAPLEELADATLPDIATLVRNEVRASEAIASELWRRLSAAKGHGGCHERQ